jgi:ribonuclease P protein component
MGKFIVIRYRPNQEENNRYSVIISKKISKKATDRNQIRRQLYEQIRLSHNEESVQTQQFDILILPKKAIMDASTNHIQDDINSLLNTIR